MPKKNVLIVDRDVYLAGIYANRFEVAGWKAVVEETINGARKAVEKSVPDVLIVDLEPTERVIAFLQEIRKDPKTAGVLQVAVTALGDRAQMQQALKAGVDSYVLKGHFVPAEAVKKVKRLLEEKTRV